MLTEGRLEFRRRMENDPPWPGEPRVGPVLNLLHGRELIRLVAQHPALGQIQIEEPGDPRPRAECASFEDGSAFILVSGGLLDFIAAVLGALVSGSNLLIAGTPLVSASATPAAVDAALSAIYASWGPSWRGTRIEVATARLPEGPASVFDRLSAATRLFLVLHEVGHAVLHAGLDPAERSHVQELEADRFALDTAIDGFGNPRNMMRTALAGAVLVPRMLEALRILGHKFPDSHPAPAERLAALHARFRERCGGDEFTYFFHITVATAQELRMEAAERRLLGLEPPTPLVTADSLVSTLMGMLIELARPQSGLAVAAAAADLQSLCDDADPVVRDRAGALARAVFRSPEAERMPDLGRAYRMLAAALPPRLHPLFLEDIP